MNGFIEVQSKGSSKLFCQGLSCGSAKYVVDVDTGSLTAKEPRKEHETLQKSELESVATKKCYLITQLLCLLHLRNVKAKPKRWSTNII